MVFVAAIYCEINIELDDLIARSSIVSRGMDGLILFFDVSCSLAAQREGDGGGSGRGWVSVRK
jgi:hypothetical protein